MLGPLWNQKVQFSLKLTVNPTVKQVEDVEPDDKKGDKAIFYHILSSPPPPPRRKLLDRRMSVMLFSVIGVRVFKFYV